MLLKNLMTAHNYHVKSSSRVTLIYAILAFFFLAAQPESTRAEWTSTPFPSPTPFPTPRPTPGPMSGLGGGMMRGSPSPVSREDEMRAFFEQLRSPDPEVRRQALNRNNAPVSHPVAEWATPTPTPRPTPNPMSGLGGGGYPWGPHSGAVPSLGGMSMQHPMPPMMGGGMMGGGMMGGGMMGGGMMGGGMMGGGMMGGGMMGWAAV
jgi:hypothetical protein